MIGFSKQKAYFDSLLREQKLGHAYIFHGPQMIGKKSFALELYRQANERIDLPLENDPDMNLIALSEDPEETREISIKIIRDLKSAASLSPYYGPYKFIVIDSANAMTVEASNALLKLLEEPPLHVVFILITTSPKLLLPTIASRCQDVAFQKQTAAEVAEYLENIKIGKEDRELLLKLGQNSIGAIARLVAEDKLGEIKKSLEQFDSILNKPLGERLVAAKKIYEKGDYAATIGHAISWYYGQETSNPKLLSGLLKLNTTLSKPEFNARLALENFFVSL